MGLFTFDKLPFNTLVGADRKTFDRVVKDREIAPTCRTKYRLTKICQRLLNPFYKRNTRLFEQMQKPEIHAPVFIIGHWRSGTTFVHNVLSCDPQFGYCTTYQTVFPHLMLFGDRFFKWAASCCMPSTRPTDSLELSVEQPQEEEFALANMTPMAHYHFWLYPQEMTHYRKHSLILWSATEEEKDELMEAQRKMMQIALHCQKKERFLSKNPPHTGRVKELLEAFPDAKFIYLVRNPYTVFESTRNFFSRTMPPLALQSISKEELEQQILENYRAMYQKYEQDKGLIPEGSLIEVRFEDFEADPIGMAEQIYQTLGLGDFQKVRPYLGKYVKKKEGFRKNRYQYDRRTIELVEKHWGEALTQWNYQLDVED